MLGGGALDKLFLSKKGVIPIIGAPLITLGWGLLIFLGIMLLLFGGTALFAMFKILSIKTGPLPLWGSILLALTIIYMIRRRD